jgi:SAM-dependent methyltransferase
LCDRQNTGRVNGQARAPTLVSRSERGAVGLRFNLYLIYKQKVYEILEHLGEGALVLDLGSREGSFADGGYPVRAVRLDIGSPQRATRMFVQADAARLPFAARTFHAVILNHSLEHIRELKPALQEVGRVVRRDGAVFVSVPDATTIADRVYRKVYRNRGGHVNLFDSAEKLERMLAWYIGLPHVATRTLHTSMNFLNRRNTREAVRLRQMLFAGLPEFILAPIGAAARWMDRWFGSRLSVYGWAFYFGRIEDAVDTTPLENVCVRCGQAHPADELLRRGIRRRLLLKSYQCADCGAHNIFTSPVKRKA